MLAAGFDPIAEKTRAMSNSDYPENDGQSDADIAAEIAAANAGEETIVEFDEETDEQNSEKDSNDVQSEVTGLKDQILRLAAELENTRRRGEREKGDATRYAIANFARDLLSVADNFERALATLPEDSVDLTPEAVSGVITGLRMTDNELRTVLQRHGVKQIETTNVKFDPNLHQAVAQAPSDAPAGHVADVAQSGFTIGERVLRAAMVVVSTGAAKNEGGPASTDQGEPGAKLDTQA